MDSPAVRTHARASVEVTKRDRQIGGAVVKRLGSVRVGAARGARRWWVWTGRPASLATSWRLSFVDETRIPLKSGGLNIAWQVSNWTDRLFMFALILAAPTFLQGPLRWIATRPTRRLGFYLLAVTAVAAFILIGHPAGKE
jgi:hypothetical protein